MLEELRERFEKIRKWDDDTSLRIHRALSWAERGLLAKESDDPDAACIFFWIAFNAMYARKTADYTEGREQQDMSKFLRTVADLDTGKTVYTALWGCWEDALEGFIANQFVYKPFWDHEKGIPNNENWKQRLEEDKQRAQQLHRRQDGLPAMRTLFERLYVLRNQLHHGGSTGSSSRNRRQVEAGAAVMAQIVPKLIGVIIDNPDKDWGEAYYPVMPDA